MHAIAKSDIGHAADMADLLGLVGTLHENVLASAIGDATTHGLSYATLAREARTAGDREAAKLFHRLTADETEAAIALLGLASRHSAATGDWLADRREPSPAPHPIESQSDRAPTAGAEVA